MSRFLFFCAKTPTRTALELISVGTSQVSVMEQQLLLSFGSPDFFPLGITPAFARVSDLNRDSSPDPVVADFSPEFEIFVNQGDGTFELLVREFQPI
jgi:hypothetical protein